MPELLSTGIIISIVLNVLYSITYAKPICLKLNDKGNENKVNCSKEEPQDWQISFV